MINRTKLEVVCGNIGYKIGVTIAKGINATVKAISELPEKLSETESKDNNNN